MKSLHAISIEYHIILLRDSHILLNYDMNAIDDKIDHSRDEDCFREENAFFALLITVNVDPQRKLLLWGILRLRISRDLSVPPVHDLLDICMV